MSCDKDMRHKEIADELQLSVNTVENHIGAYLVFRCRNLKKHTDLAFGLMLWFFIYLRDLGLGG